MYKLKLVTHRATYDGTVCFIFYIVTITRGENIYLSPGGLSVSKKRVRIGAYGKIPACGIDIINVCAAVVERELYTDVS